MRNINLLPPRNINVVYTIIVSTPINNDFSFYAENILSAKDAFYVLIYVTNDIH